MHPKSHFRLPDNSFSTFCSKSVSYPARLHRNHSPLNGRTRFHCLIPPLDIRKFLERNSLPLEPRAPGKNCHIRYRIFICSYPIFMGQPCVKYGPKTTGLFCVPLNTVRNLLPARPTKMMGLPKDWTDSTHLKHQPLQDFPEKPSLSLPCFSESPAWKEPSF